MKTSWCALTASKAFIDTVKAMKQRDSEGRLVGDHLPFKDSGDSDVAELVSAMAAGYKARLIVEAWARGSDVATTVGLAIASKHSGASHVCVVPDERARQEYLETTRRAGVEPRVVVGEAEDAMRELSGAVDFLVVDCRRKDLARVVRSAQISHRGAVLVCKGAGARGAPGLRWRAALGKGTRVLRSVYLPVGTGVEISEVGHGESLLESRWIKHIDRDTGEEHVFRR